MKLTFYSTKKRINSFARPEEEQHASPVVLNAVFLKDTDTSMSTPTFYIAAANFPEVNYCVLENFHAPDGSGHIHRPSKIYYWITDIISDHTNRWYIKCEIDLLATWKSQILSQTAFVERSASAFNNTLIDDLLPQETECDRRITISNSEIGTNNVQAGMFCLGVLGKGSGYGMVRYYLMNWVEVSNFAMAINSPTFAESVKQDFNDITSCLISLTYLPFSNALSMFSVSDSNQNIYLGGYDTGTSGRPLAGFCGHKMATVTIPRKWSDYRQVSNSTIELYLPLYGKIAVSPFDIFGQGVNAAQDGYITADYVIDAPTGGGTIQLRSDGCIISTLTGQIGASMPITAYKNGAGASLISFISSISAFGLAVAATAISGGAGAMALGALAGGVASGVQSIRQNFQMTGSSVGGMAGMSGTGMNMYMQAYTRYFDTSDQPSNIANLIGRPTHKVLQLNQLTGYVKTKNFRLANSGYMTLLEQKKIENMFNNEGVFI